MLHRWKLLQLKLRLFVGNVGVQEKDAALRAETRAWAWPRFLSDHLRGYSTDSNGSAVNILDPICQTASAQVFRHLQVRRDALY